MTNNRNVIKGDISARSNDLVIFLKQKVYPSVNGLQLLSQFDPVDKGGYLSLNCPQCGRPEAFYYHGSSHLCCNRRNACGYRASLLDVLADDPIQGGADFVSAVRGLASLTGIEMPDIQSSDSIDTEAWCWHERSTKLEIILAICQRRLHFGEFENVRKYLQDRGLDESAVEDLKLGLYPPPMQLHMDLGVAGHNPEEFDAMELISHTLNGYIIFPWYDELGHLQTLYGRWPGTPPEGKKKLMALVGAGSKSSPLYLDRARRSGCKDLVIVEGVIDAAVLQALGESNVVAIVGANIASSQLETIKRYKPDSVTICLDPDGAGKKGTLITVQKLLAEDIPSFVAPVLPEGNDPDEFVLGKGIEAWRAHIRQAIRGSVFTARELAKKHALESEQGRNQAAVDIIEYAASLSNPLDQSDVRVELTRVTGYGDEDLLSLQEKVHLKATQKNQRDKLAQVLSRSQTALRQDSETPAIIASNAASELQSLAVGNTDAHTEILCLDDVFTEIREMPSGRPLGWRKLDNLDVVVRPGELVIAAGRTGHLKTTFLLNTMARWLDSSCSERFLFASYELPKTAIYLKLISLLTRSKDGLGLSYDEVSEMLKGRCIDELGFDDAGCAMRTAIACLRRWEERLLITYQPGWDVAQLANKVRSLAAEPAGLAGVSIDYLQLVPPPAGQYDRRDQQISAVTQTLKKLAVEIGVPVIVAAQLSRKPTEQAPKIPVEKRVVDKDVIAAIKRRRPQLHHIREGGSEQAADLVLGILNFAADYAHEGGEHQAEEGMTPVEISVLKSRFGRLGYRTLYLHGPTGCIDDNRDGENFTMLDE